MEHSPADAGALDLQGHLPRSRFGDGGIYQLDMTVCRNVKRWVSKRARIALDGVNIALAVGMSVGMGFDTASAVRTVGLVDSDGRHL